MVDRTRGAAALDAFVAEHRVTVAAVVPLVGAALLVAGDAGLVPRALVYAPALLVTATAVMRLPLAAALVPVVDRRALAGLGALAALTYAVELAGVVTGWPYGEFAYGVRLGPTLFGLVPLALPLFFLPLVLDAHLLAVHLLGDRAADARLRVPLALFCLVGVDLVLDPAAVALRFWTYAGGGPYYGVPLSNFGGWLLTGTLSLAVVELTVAGPALRDRVAACPFALDDVVSFALLWGVVDVAAGNAVPAVLAAALLAALAATGRLSPGPLTRRRPAGE